MWFLFLLFWPTESTHYPIERCYTYDCSYQLPNAPDGSCLIYNTSVCLGSFLQSNHSDISNLTSEANSVFTVSVIPYQAEIILYHPIPVSPMNITFHIHQEGVNQIAVKITAEDLPNPICRVFDFTNFTVNHNFPITLFYECLYFENHIRNIFMEFINLSTFEKLGYYVYVPSAKHLKSACDWHPIIMVFYGSLSQKRIEIKFSQAPQWMNISTYIIKFFPRSSREKVFTLSADKKSDMLYMEHMSTDDDYYTVSVFPVIEGRNNCTPAETAAFYVGTSKADFDRIIMMIMMYVCIILLIFGLAAFLILYWSYSGKSEPRVLLVHFKDDVFENVVQAFINFLTIQYGCIISTIYGNSTHPLEGWDEMLSYSDCIVIVISEKLYVSWDSKNFQKVEADHHFYNQPVVVGNIIYRQLFDPDPKFKKIKVATICFSSADANYVPDWVKLITRKCYTLPEEISTFLYFIFNYPHFVPCSKLQSWWFSNNIEYCKEGKIFSEALQAFLESDLCVIDHSNQIKNNNAIAMQTCHVTCKTVSESTSLLGIPVNSNSFITNCSSHSSLSSSSNCLSNPSLSSSSNCSFNSSLSNPSNCSSNSSLSSSSNSKSFETNDVKTPSSCDESEMSDDSTTSFIESISEIEPPRKKALLDPTVNTIMPGGTELYLSQAKKAKLILSLMPGNNVDIDDENDFSSALDELINAT